MEKSRLYLTITPPSPEAEKALRQALARYEGPHIPAELTVAAAGPASDGGGAVFHLACGAHERDLAAPLRLGTLLEKARVFLSSPSPQILTWGPYTLDLVGRLWQGPEEGAEPPMPVELTDREAALLEALISAPGHRLERAALLEHVWGYHKDAETHTLETHIYRLRRKIERDAAHPRLLLTEGSAYRLSV